MTDTTLAALGDRLWDRMLDREPYFRLRAGLPVHVIPTGSLQEAADDAAFMRQLAADAKAIDESALTAPERATLQVLLDQAETGSQAEEMWWEDLPVTPYTLMGLAHVVQLVLLGIDVDAAGEADRLAAVARSVAAAIDTRREKLLAMAERGWRVPRPALPGSIAAVAGLRDVTAAAVARGEAAYGPALREQVVVPAFERLLAALGDPAYHDAAPEVVGLGTFPGGEAAYGRLLRLHATYDIAPEEVQRIGYAQLEQLAERKRAIRTALGFPDDAAFVEHLRDVGRLHAASPEAVQADFDRHLRRIEPLIPSVFAVLPEAPYGTARLDPSQEAGLTFGFYEPPTPDQPIGRYRFNGSGLAERSHLNAAALIFHELIPGHHFHIARQAEDRDLPRFQAEGTSYAAFTEGWAEYAAGLAGELGMYDDPYDDYGHAVHQSMLALRLVVDPGMNVLGMGLDEARALMAAHCMESPTQIATETLRYATDIPGQAVAYRLGHTRFLHLREAARRDLGEAFDIREFHEVVLRSGARPLSVVEADVAAMVADRRAAAAGDAR